MNADQIDTMVRENMGLVKKACEKYKARASAIGMEYEDLDAIGRMALFLACRRFKPELGYRFSTYAVSTIQGEMLTAFREYNVGLTFDRRAKNLGGKIHRLQLEEEPIEDICKALEVTPEEVEEALEYLTYHMPASLDYVLAEDDNFTVADTVFIDPREEVMRNIILDEFISILDADSQKLIRLYQSGKSRQAVAEALNISESQASRRLQTLVSLAETYGKGDGFERSSKQGKYKSKHVIGRQSEGFTRAG
jgi:RNA polymerase sporulation-specific sigma factor